MSSERVRLVVFTVVSVVLVTVPSRARAEAAEDPRIEDAHEAQQDRAERGASAPARQQVEAASEPPKHSEPEDPKPAFTVGGYVETFYQYNFNAPGNGISSYRAYDDRHNTLTLQNAVLDVGFRAKDLLARVAFQVGRTPASMYAEESDLPGDGSVGETSPLLWRHLQRASVGWQATELVLIEAGLFPTNVNIESVPVRENWNWSRTTLALRMPNYFAGAKVTMTPSKRLDVSAMVVNGWNRVVDDNDEKSGVLQAVYRVQDRFTGSIAYVGGVEREGGAPEGRAYRHFADAWIQLDVVSPLEIGADLLGGAEHGRFGAHWFAGAAAFTRVHVVDPLWLAFRVDRVWEDAAANARGVSRPILVPAKHVTSVTVTVELQPVKGLSIRLEGRHDLAAADLFYRGEVEGDGTPERPFVPNARTQTTVLLGMVAWF